MAASNLAMFIRDDENILNRPTGFSAPGDPFPEAIIPESSLFPTPQDNDGENNTFFCSWCPGRNR